MRLNKEYHSRHPEQEREIRRRTFWACLQIDRLLAFSLVKPRTLSLRNVNISLPSTDISLAYGEKTRGVTLETLANFNGNPSDIGIQSYLIKSICIWSDFADFHVTQERMVSKLPPTDPSSRFAQLCASLQDWTDNLPPRMQWSEENYRIHLDLNQGAAYMAIHCLLQSAWCVSHQDYLPQTDEHSILLDYMDPAGWSFLHREQTLISTCVSHALQVGKLIDAYLSFDRHLENQGQSIFLALSVLSTASPLLWLRYTQDECSSEGDKDLADTYFENYIRLVRSWRGAWDIAHTWLRQLEEMRSLYRFAYMGILDDSVHMEAPSRCSSPTNQSPQSPEYRPSPGDGLPPATISKNIYSLLRLNRTANLNLREEYQSSIWVTLTQGWPQSVDISAWDESMQEQVPSASMKWQ
ncbi:uncharacterized protein N7496_001715 [Penicillium cataractarum]|uniref:Xylanolytic transcriptional activator regulatory domain-containing protein n=1 Tax=Penicillium cataractarum TaxID=2100454 RepID=A0A9W9VWI0_9EURO|nr:uncharacterized protein N7496_001715 [Penicillium cataractarum]KAJ5390647.1 hypothetical protein N7496_001715 [Penicillium cataractarum]